jgi:hypothetical protein
LCYGGASRSPAYRANQNAFFDATDLAVTAAWIVAGPSMSKHVGVRGAHLQLAAEGLGDAIDLLLEPTSAFTVRASIGDDCKMCGSLLERHLGAVMR